MQGPFIYILLFIVRVNSKQEINWQNWGMRTHLVSKFEIDPNITPGVIWQIKVDNSSTLAPLEIQLKNEWWWIILKEPHQETEPSDQIQLPSEEL